MAASLQEWQKFYDDIFDWKTTIEGDYLLLETGPKSVVALEFHHQYEVYERFVEWDLKLADRQYHDCAFAQINGHKVLFFKFGQRVVDEYKQMKSLNECINYNNAGPLYWTFHNVGGKLPVEPSPGCKWPVSRENLQLYMSQKLQFKNPTDDAAIGAIITGTLYEGTFPDGKLMFRYDKKEAENLTLRPYPRIKAIPKIFDEHCKVEIEHYQKLANNAGDQEIINYLVNCLAYVSQGAKGIWMTKSIDLNGEIIYEMLKTSELKAGDLGREKRKFRGKMTTLFNVVEQIRHQIQYSRIYFHPCRDLAEYYFKHERKTFNLFTGFKAPMTHGFDQGAVDGILGHIKRVFGWESDIIYKYLINWMADIVQYPDRKIGKALLIRSSEGAGKNSFWLWFGQNILGKKYYLECGFEDINKNFNNISSNRLLTVVAEAKNGELAKHHEKVKRMITDTQAVLEKKNFDSIQVDDFNRYVVLTNEYIPVKITGRDRRWVALDADGTEIDNKAYWDNLFANVLTPQTAIHFYNYLVSLDISKWNYKAIPGTKARLEMKTDSAPLPWRFMIDYCGQLERGEPQFVSTDAMYGLFTNWLTQNGINVNISKVMFSTYIARLKLTKKTDRIEQPDGTRKQVNGYKWSYETVLAALRREVAHNLVLPEDDVDA